MKLQKHIVKKVVPLFTKLFDVLKSINREYLELKNKYYELLSDYKYQIDRNGALVRRNRELVKDNEDLNENLSVAAHLIHGSSDGRFSVTYAVKNITREEIESVGFLSADYDEMVKKYDPRKLEYGYNTLEDGEEVYYIPNPALGLWINREKFDQ